MNLIDIRDRKKKRFADFSHEPEILCGDKIPIERVLNKEIEVIGYRITTTKYPKNKSGKCLTVQFVADSADPRVFFTGSDVLIDQMEKYGNEVPFVATIKKIDKYFTFS